MRRFIVETELYGGSWENCWKECKANGEEAPDSFDRAEEALEEALDCVNAMLENNPDYEPDTLRVVNVATQEACDIRFEKLANRRTMFFEASLGKPYKIES